MRNGFKMKGRYQLEHWRNGKLLQVLKGHNDIVDEGLDKLLDVQFHGTTPINPWYIGLVDNASWTAFADADTLASHAGWLENTDYAGTRKEWTEDAASGQSITNTTVVTFVMNATKVIKGIFVNSATSGTVGTLWATASFASTISVVNADEIKLTYTVDAAHA